jgi:multidrug resistance efflux pump
MTTSEKDVEAAEGTSVRRVPAGRLADAPRVKRRRRSDGRTARLVRRGVTVLLLGAGVALAVVYREELMEKGRGYFAPRVAVTEGIQVATVKRGPLRITLAQEGKLRAVKNNLINLEVRGKITWLAEAGSKVKPGDPLAKVDTKDYDDQKQRLAADLETAKQQLVIAEQAIPITESKGKSEVSTAETKRQEAELALKLYTTLDVPKKLNDFETSVNDTRTKLQDAQKKQTEFQAALDEALLQDADAKKSAEDSLALSKQTVASLQKVVKNTEEQRKLFRAYSYPQDLKSKQQALKNAELEVEKARTNAKSEMLQKQADLTKAKSAIDRITRDLKRTDESIAKCTALSPVEGLVFYGNTEDRYNDYGDRVRVGMDWYSGSPIMTIPDLSAFQVSVEIPEVYRGRVMLGMPAQVTIEAVPGLVMEGKLKTLASVARNKITWDTSSPQVFDAMVSLDKWDVRLVAGMTTRVEVTTGYLADAIFVPVEAVFNDAGKTVAYVSRAGKVEKGDPNKEGLPEKRPVGVGQANDHVVAVLIGLKEGEQVLLAQPHNFYLPVDFKERSDAVQAATRAAAIAASTAKSQPATSAAVQSGTMPAATQDAAPR